MAKTRRLTPELVIETAARLANERGDVSQITLTNLAAELNIRVPSLYNHVKGLEGLQRDLTVWGLQQLLAITREAVLGKLVAMPCWLSPTPIAPSPMPSRASIRWC